MANKYGTLLMIQIGMISLDFIFNILNVLITTNDAIQLMLHLLQDTLIVLSIIVILITFSSTFVFQAGLITLLLSKFASTIILSSLYLALSILFHFYDMRHRWSAVDQTAILYYFTYKRAILLLSNPKYHHDSEWIREQIRREN